MHCIPAPPGAAPALDSNGRRPRALRTIAFGLLAAALAACAGTKSTHAPSSSSTSSALTAGMTATVEGRVSAVDTAPWAYDGNAIVKLESGAHGLVELHFPARWNLCRAGDIGDLQAIAPGTRVRATGTVNTPATLTVCEDASHGLQRLD